MSWKSLKRPSFDEVLDLVVAKPFKWSGKVIPKGAKWKLHRGPKAGRKELQRTRMLYEQRYLMAVPPVLLKVPVNPKATEPKKEPPKPKGK